MKVGRGGGVADRKPVEHGVIERHQDAAVRRRCGGSRGVGQADGPQPTSSPGEEGFEGDPKEQQQKSNGEGNHDHKNDGSPAARGFQPPADGLNRQPGIQAHDDDGRCPSEDSNPISIRERSHPGAVAGEMDKRNDSERKLHAEDRLAQKQRPKVELSPAYQIVQSGRNNS